jgi:hypothetical protein
MGFESVRGYTELASGLSDVTRARAMEAAQGLLAMPAAGVATGSKVALQATSLVDEVLAAAVANRSSLTDLVRSEVDVAITRLGLVPVHKLEEAQAEAERLRAEVARLRSAAPKGSAPKAAAPTSAPAARSTTRKATARKATVRKPAKTASMATKATNGRSAVTTRLSSADTESL